jgi:flagellar basal-body rod protein FlgF
MIRALYTASSGMVAQTLKQDVIANNIANAQTAGFRRERVTQSAFAQALEESTRAMAPTKVEYPTPQARACLVGALEATDDSQGPIRNTGNNLDFAIEGPGAFEVSTPNGGRHTRCGSFRLNANRELCTAEGWTVLGQSGPVQVPKGEWEVTPDGKVMADGRLVDSIKIAGADSARTRLLQGCLEDSNVQIVSEMVAMITNMRSFEANQKMIQSVDHSLDKLINDVGRV